MSADTDLDGQSRRLRAEWRALLQSAFEAYAVHRLLSGHQQRVLRLYLQGSNDKEIAENTRCSQATVYEHWRRMARKAGGLYKHDVVADFHRFLGGG